MPKRPSSPISGHRSRGNLLVRSISSARGAMRSCAKPDTLSRSMSISGPSPKSKPVHAFEIMRDLPTSMATIPRAAPAGASVVFSMQIKVVSMRAIGFARTFVPRGDIDLDNGERAAGPQHPGAGDESSPTAGASRLIFISTVSGADFFGISEYAAKPAAVSAIAVVTPPCRKPRCWHRSVAKRQQQRDAAGRKRENARRRSGA